MVLNRLSTYISLILFLWVLTPDFVILKEESTIPTFYVVTYSNLLIPTPIYYRIIEAKVTIGVHVKESTDKIILGRPEGIRTYTVTLNGTSCAYNATDYGPTLMVYAPAKHPTLKAGQNYILEIEFKTEPDNILLAVNDYSNPITGKKVEFAFGINPINAYEAFPCYRNYSHRASISMKVDKIPEEYKLLMSSGMKPIPRDTGVCSGWGPTPNTMPIDKFGMVIGKFPPCPYREDDDDVHYCIHFHQDAVPFPHDDARSRRTFQAMKQMLKYVAGYLNTTMIPNKLDLVVMPPLTREIQNSWGLIFIQEEILATDSVLDVHHMYLELATLIVHQYFGVLVTPEPDKFSWLIEGVQNYLAFKIVHALYPDYDSFIQAHVESYQHAMREDGWEDTVSMDDNRSFDINAHKAGSILRMLERVFGQFAIQEALQNYLKIGQTKYVEPNDLSVLIKPSENEEHFRQEMNTLLQGLKKVFGGFGSLMPNLDKYSDSESPKKEQNKDFIYPEAILTAWSARRGYPLVNASISDTHITFTQGRFSYLRETPLLPRPKLDPLPIPLWIPIRDEYVWLTNDTLIIEKPKKFEDWMLAHVGKSGFFRMNFPEEVWENAMVKKLMSNDFAKISVESRARLIADSMHLARGGYINYKIAWKVMEYLKKETELRPWAAAHDNFKFQLRRVSGNSEHENAVRKFIKDKVSGLFDKYKLTDDGDRMLTDTCLQNIFIDLAARSIYVNPRTWGTKPTYKAYGANVRETIGCKMVAALGPNAKSLLGETWAMSETFEKRFERRYFLRILTCTRDYMLIRSYLRTMFKGTKHLQAERGHLAELFIKNSNPHTIGTIITHLTELVAIPKQLTLDYEWLKLRQNMDFIRFVYLLRRFSAEGEATEKYDVLETIIHPSATVRPTPKIED